MKEITQSQKKIIVMGSIVIAAFITFWLFVYMPASNTVSRIKSDLANVEMQIKEIEAMIDDSIPLNESIMLLRSRSEYLSTKFPPKEEEALRMLSDFAQKSHIEVLSIKPEPKRVFLSEDDKEVGIEGKVCQEIYVFMTLSCSYNELVRYINALKQSLPAFVTIDKITINKRTRGSQDKIKRRDLNVTLGLNFYLLS